MAYTFFICGIALAELVEMGMGVAGDAAMAMDTDLNCGDPRMTRTMRMIFRDTHNNLRGSIARGQTERNGDWGIAPPATLMYRMKYDCEAEAYAMSHAQTCDRELLLPDERPGYKENIHVLDTVQTTPEGAAQHAMMKWWSQLASRGIRTDMRYTPEVHASMANKVSKFTKMAWWNNMKVGCAVQNCGTFYFVVCMYRPGGNDIGNNVYRVGAVCSECLGKCVDGLCWW
ncbi:hypothetical protein Y032_0036g3213 [Ancylostoma ceylanicum]|uniref:SCP domain-containing protein n=1 Tax=Ancylostoma ceylanicum TaxID=53326 RepID=A0A016UL62_9BILA|nr:hypothetical protein Y032_0036g3213 [Ancylostoma ceylanicum]